MRTFYDTIIISPHLDDAALSCGGQIYMMTRQGQAVLIVTLMAGTPTEKALSHYAVDLHQRWQLRDDAVTRRRDEDIEAARLLGADYLHGPIPDCIYRCSQNSEIPFYISDEDIFGEIDPEENSLIKAAAQYLASLPQAKSIFAPLGVGNHVDHQISRLASEACFGKGLFYYEEYPYAAEPGAVEKIIARERGNWSAQTTPISPEVLQVKVEAVAAYKSQLSTFFTDRHDLDHQIFDYTESIGGERIWRRILW